MKHKVRILCAALTALWFQNAGAMGPGAATPGNSGNSAVTDKVDQKTIKGRLEAKGKRSQKLQDARKPVPQKGE